MQAKLLRFGVVEIDGVEYEHDVVIDCGVVTKRDKKPSKQFRRSYGHTPLSDAETIPWGGDRLIIGTGVDDALPVMAEVQAEAQRRDIDLVALPTEQACALISTLPDKDVRAILHVTC